MDTPLTARHLSEICADLEWSQQELEKRTGIVRTTISTHLSGERPIRDNHIAAYVRAVPVVDKLRLLIVWIRDVFDIDDLSHLLGADDARLKEEASTWLPSLDEEQRSSLQWLAGEMIKDREMDAWMLGMIRSLGYKRPTAGA